MLLLCSDFELLGRRVSIFIVLFIAFEPMDLQKLLDCNSHQSQPAQWKVRGYDKTKSGEPSLQLSLCSPRFLWMKQQSPGIWGILNLPAVVNGGCLFSLEGYLFIKGFLNPLPGPEPNLCHWDGLQWQWQTQELYRRWCQVAVDNHVVTSYTIPAGGKHTGPQDCPASICSVKRKAVLCSYSPTVGIRIKIH